MNGWKPQENLGKDAWKTCGPARPASRFPGLEWCLGSLQEPGAQIQFQSSKPPERCLKRGFGQLQASFQCPETRTAKTARAQIKHGAPHLTVSCLGRPVVFCFNGQHKEHHQLFCRVSKKNGGGAFPREPCWGIPSFRFHVQSIFWNATDSIASQQNNERQEAGSQYVWDTSRVPLFDCPWMDLNPGSFLGGE